MPGMDMLGLRHPFFAPLWRRIATAGFCLGWAVVELVSGSPLWALLFGGLGLAAAWVFFFDWTPPGKADATPPNDDDAP